METKKSTKTIPMSESAMRAEDMSVLARLRAEEKVPIMILPDGGDSALRVTINGVRYEIPKGETVNVPQSVYALIMNSNRTIKQADALAKANEYREIAPMR